MDAKKTQPPWTQSPPKGIRHAHLSPKMKALAEERAEKAGRHYPNLVDNMWAARETHKG